jgi:hypothetical protein
VTVRWYRNDASSYTIFRNTGIGTAYLRRLRVESRRMHGERREGYAVDEMIAIPSGGDYLLNFGDSDYGFDRIYGFIELRVRADLTDVNERRLLGIDERFEGADTQDMRPDQRIWYAKSKNIGSFVP